MDVCGVLQTRAIFIITQIDFELSSAKREYTQTDIEKVAKQDSKTNIPEEENHLTHEKGIGRFPLYFVP